MKLPHSVLVVVHTADMEVLLLERAARPARGLDIGPVGG